MNNLVASSLLNNIVETRMKNIVETTIEGTILLDQQCCSRMTTMLFKYFSGNNPGTACEILACVVHNGKMLLATSGKQGLFLYLIQVLKNFPKAKVLACAPSNSAADLILQRVSQHNPVPNAQMVRLNAYGRAVSSIMDPKLMVWSLIFKADTLV